MDDGYDPNADPINIVAGKFAKSALNIYGKYANNCFLPTNVTQKPSTLADTTRKVWNAKYNLKGASHMPHVTDLGNLAHVHFSGIDFR